VDRTDQSHAEQVSLRRTLEDVDRTKALALTLQFASSRGRSKKLNDGRLQQHIKLAMLRKAFNDRHSNVDDAESTTQTGVGRIDIVKSCCGNAAQEIGVVVAVGDVERRI
jgi:hypothetical protein